MVFTLYRDVEVTESVVDHLSSDQFEEHYIADEEMESKQMIRCIDTAYRAVDLVKTKGLLQILTEKDKRRVQKFMKSQTYYGRNVLFTLVKSSSPTILEFVNNSSLEDLKVIQTRIEATCQKILALLEEPELIDYEKYMKLCESMNSEKHQTYYRYTIRTKIYYCVSCSSVARLKSSKTVRRDCNSDFCGASCWRCSSTVEVYSCKC